jgi:hypothetical protein
LGRTNKAVPLNNVQLDANGNPIPGTGTNQVGRYALHFHRDYYPGLNGNDPPIQVVGNFEAGSPGWGYVNHSSNVDFIDNVAYNNFGSAFVTEAGNELGSFQNNLAVDTIGVPNGLNTVPNRTNVQDFGFGGEGFWLQGPGTSIVNNIVDEAQIGYSLWGLGLTQPGLGPTHFWTSTTNPTKTVFDARAPLAAFAGNQAANVNNVLSIYDRLPPAGTPDTIEGLTAWGITQNGIVDRSSNLVVQNSSLVAASNKPGFGVYGVGGYASGISLVNTDVQGFATGVDFPTDPRPNSVTSGYWDNRTNFLIWPASKDVTFSGPITFGPHSKLDYNLQEPILTGDLTTLSSPSQILLPNGQELYFTKQVANYVPFSTAAPNVPAAFVGLTNAQLYQQFGMAVDGMPAPVDATTDPSTNGLIGSAVTPRLSAGFVSLNYGQAESPYILRYNIHPFSTSFQLPVYTDPTAVVLQPGWNVITRVINGVTYSWLVQGVVFNQYFVPNGTVGSAYTQSITAPAGYTVAFTVTSGAIPAGLALTSANNTLAIAGTPTTAGSANLLLTATSPSGKITTQGYTLTVNPENVSGQVSWTASAQTYNPSTQTYDNTITLTNHGPTALTGTLAVALTGLPTGVTTLANTNGTYQGNPYILVSLPDGTLAAEQTVTFTVQFRFPMKGYGLTTYEQSL